MLVMNTGSNAMSMDLDGPDVDFLLDAIGAKREQLLRDRATGETPFETANRLLSEVEAWDFAISDCR